LRVIVGQKDSLDAVGVAGYGEAGRLVGCPASGRKQKESLSFNNNRLKGGLSSDWGKKKPQPHWRLEL